MSRGRPPKGIQHVDSTEASDETKQRLKILLQTLSGELSVEQACAQLQISEARFHELRTGWLQSAVDALEPKPKGRPPAPPPQEPGELDQLRARVKRLELELRAAQIREQIAAMMPHLLHPPTDQDKKK
ncbi:MAG: hypothetical protein HC834_06225 [Rhodospirillales bacterium]|nr:hypothetical protein [Rhodospirillales bacterium]